MPCVSDKLAHRPHHFFVERSGKLPHVLASRIAQGVAQAEGSIVYHTRRAEVLQTDLAAMSEDIHDVSRLTMCVRCGGFRIEWAIESELDQCGVRFDGRLHLRQAYRSCRFVKARASTAHFILQFFSLPFQLFDLLLMIGERSL